MTWPDGQATGGAEGRRVRPAALGPARCRARREMRPGRVTAHARELGPGRRGARRRPASWPPLPGSFSTGQVSRPASVGSRSTYHHGGSPTSRRSLGDVGPEHRREPSGQPSRRAPLRPRPGSRRARRRPARACRCGPGRSSSAAASRAAGRRSSSTAGWRRRPGPWPRRRAGTRAGTRSRAGSRSPAGPRRWRTQYERIKSSGHTGSCAGWLAAVVLGAAAGLVEDLQHGVPDHHPTARPRPVVAL